MASFENLTTPELMILAKLRNVDGYENMCMQQLENILTTTSSPKHAPKPAFRPKTHTPTTDPIPISSKS